MAAVAWSQLVHFVCQSIHLSFCYWYHHDITEPWLMQDLPPNLLPYLRLGHCSSSEELKQIGAFSQTAAPLPPQQEALVLQNLASCLQQRLQRCDRCQPPTAPGFPHGPFPDPLFCNCACSTGKAPCCQQQLQRCRSLWP